MAIIFIRATISAMLLMGAAWSASAQEVPAGGTARSSIGQVGQRQTREQVETQLFGRIGTRIQNRVQSRIRNRIDRFYNPDANATSPFVVASDQSRTAGRQQ